MNPSTMPLEGQDIHAIDLSFNRLPTGRFSAVTSTLTVGSFWMTVSTSSGAFLPERRMANMPARPAATTATARIMIRVGFMAIP